MDSGCGGVDSKIDALASIGALQHERKLLTAALPIFIRPLSLAFVLNDTLMFNLQAYPEAEVKFVLQYVPYLLSLICLLLPALFFWGEKKTCYSSNEHLQYGFICKFMLASASV